MLLLRILFIGLFLKHFDGYIHNGDDSPPALYRWFVHNGQCGGALVSSRIVITAAHCVEKMMDKQKDWESEVVTRAVNKWHWRKKDALKRFPLRAEAIYIPDKQFFSPATDWALILLQKPVSVCDDRFGPLAPLLPFGEGQEPEEMIKADRNHQCLIAGYGTQLPKEHNKFGKDGNHFMRQMRQLRINYIKTEMKQGDKKQHKSLSFYAKPGDRSDSGDSGSPIFCIVDDYPILVSDLFGGGAPSKPVNGIIPQWSLGPALRDFRGEIEKVLTKWNQMETMQRDQDKCRSYYKKYGFLNEYVDRIKKQLYPERNITIDTDRFHYPSVDSIDMDGSYRKEPIEALNTVKTTHLITIIVTTFS